MLQSIKESERHNSSVQCRHRQNRKANVSGEMCSLRVSENEVPDVRTAPKRWRKTAISKNLYTVPLKSLYLTHGHINGITDIRPQG